MIEPLQGFYRTLSESKARGALWRVVGYESQHNGLECC